MGASVGSVTHSAKFTLPSLSVSYRLQASRVLLPLTLISSQFHVTWRETGRLASSTQSCVRSFWPGSSFAPAVSLTHVRAACTDEDAYTAIPNARSNATTSTSMRREGDLLKRSKNDRNTGCLLSLEKKVYRMACINRISVSIDQAYCIYCMVYGHG
jgi:hypothetical protein